MLSASCSARSWWLRLFDRAGREVWQQPVPGIAWAVNISADGRFVVAGYGDGTIRWHRLSNGEEVLALFPHADRQRWMAWTPEGFYATSGPDAEELLGYHLNRGKEREGEFISARQLREHFYQPGLISQRLDANGDALLAEAVQKLGDVRELLAGAKAPAPVVELLSDAQITTAGDVPVKVRIKDQGGGIGRLIYRIDGIEFEGRMVGIAADGTDSRTFTLPPQQGQREITVSATNARGVESLPVRIVAQVQPRPSAAPSLHVLAIGVSLYRDKELQKGVRFAARDADTMGQLFRAQGARLYQSVNVRVLSDAQATGDAIRTAFAELASRVAAQDVFVLYLAGHGASFDRDYHFIPWDAVYTSTAALRQRSLTHEHFREPAGQDPGHQDSRTAGHVQCRGLWPPGRPQHWRERRHRSTESAHRAGHDCRHGRRQDGDRGRRGARRFHLRAAGGLARQGRPQRQWHRGGARACRLCGRAAARDHAQMGL